MHAKDSKSRAAEAPAIPLATAAPAAPSAAVAPTHPRRSSEPLFERLIEQSPVSTQVFAPDGTCRKVNAAWERLWGATAAEAMEYNILDDPQLVLVHNDLTEHKRLEMELAEQVEFRSAIERSMTSGIATVDEQGRQTYVNEAFCRMVDWPAPELVGREPPFVYWPPEEQEGILARLREVLAESSPGQFEVKLCRRSGERFEAIIAVSPLLDGQRRRIGWLAAVTDLTQQKRDQAALQSALQRWELAVSATQDGIWDWNPQDDQLYWSPRAKQMLGYGEDLVPTREWVRDLLHPEDRDSSWEHTKRHLAGETPYFELEYRLQHCDGSYRWVLARGVALRDAQGRPTRMIGAHTDISDRKAAEQALRDSEERFRVALKNSAVSVYTNDTDLRYTWVYNPRFGFEVSDVVGKRDGELLPMASIRELVEMKLRVMSAGAGERRQIATEIGDRGYVFDVTVEPLKREDGTITGVTVASMDLTDVVRARQEAEQASRAKDQFLAVLSHELRTPLTPVLLTLSLVQSRPDLPEDLRADLATIRRNVELESRLISDLLDLTRIGKGRLQLDMQDVDLHLVIRSAIDICQREVSAKLATDLAAKHHIVHGDGTRLQQIFWNLISNSQKFTPDDGQITVRSRDAGAGHIVVEVIDSGVGIDPAVLPRLFDAFEQGEVRDSRQQAGLGLGLAISKKLVDAHGGCISARSLGRGRGATFAVELPVLESFVPSSAPPRPMTANTAAPPLAVLLIEDHEPTLRAMVRLLSQLGHRVTAVTGAASATAAARQGQYDLIISDLGLPDGSGLDVMRQLRDQYEGRAIALTGYGMESDVHASRDAGFTEHLTKPVDFQTLESAIRRVSAR